MFFFVYTFGQKTGKTKTKARCLEIQGKDGDKLPARGKERGVGAGTDGAHLSRRAVRTCVSLG